MRFRALAVTSVALAALSVATPARAQITGPGVPSFDLAAVTRLAGQLEQMQRDYQVYLGIFGSLLRQVDPNGMASRLLSSANPMPGAGQIGQMVTGGGGFGPLAGLAGQFLQRNTYYQPQSTGADDFNALYMQRNASTLSGVQAMAQQSMTSLQDHIAGLGEIQQQLSVVKSDADLSAIRGRLEAEQANLAAQGVQAQSLQTLLAAQHDQYEQQMLQRRRQEADQMLAATASGTAAGTGQPMAAQGAQGAPMLANFTPIPSFSGEGS